MRNIWLVIKGNILRLKRDKLTLIMVFLVMPVIIALGVYFGSNNDINGKIALINPKIEEETMIKNIFKDNLSIEFEVFDKEIKNSSLITGAYLAEVTFKDNNIQVNKYSNKEISGLLNSIFNGEKYDSKEYENNVVDKIAGFLLMFLFYGALSVVTLFLKDRENGVYQRVLTGNVSFLQYNLAQILYLITTITIPTIIMSVIVTKFLNVELNMGYGNFIAIIIAIGILTSSMVIFIANIFKTTSEVQMNGAIIAMISCLFSGCLMPVEGSSKFIEIIRGILPQKRLLDFINNYNFGDLFFVIVAIILFIGVGTYIGKRNYNKGIY
ncbi:MAG: ABC transporter permease [Sarcina sp.]